MVRAVATRILRQILLVIVLGVEERRCLADLGGDGAAMRRGQRLLEAPLGVLGALALLLVGMHRQLAAVRYAGLGLLVVTLLKLFFHDLAQLDQLYRIGAFIAVAIVLIGSSYLYQRFLAVDEKKPPQA